VNKSPPDTTTEAPPDSSPAAPADRGPWPGGLEPPPLADPAPDPQRPARSVGFTISTTGYAIASRFRELLAPLGLEPRDFALLRTVASSPGVTQQAIGERMGVKPSRMVAFVDALEQRGLLERRPKPHDRRAHELFLTNQGRDVLQRAFAIAMSHEQLLTGDLNEDEREQLMELLARVGSHLGIPRGVHVGMGHSAMRDE
jgi:DNA-binding MarR family transcriptional regulator